MTPRVKTLIFGSMLAAAAFSLGWMLRARKVDPNQAVNPHPVRQTDSAYQFIRPLLGCSISESKQFDEYIPMEAKVSSMIEDKKASGDLETASVYFRDLNSGRWTGVNEDAQYTPASMLKVPTMIAFLKLAEERPEILSQEISIPANSPPSAAQVIPPTHSVEPGHSYTIEQLIEYMIAYSDNGATIALDKLTTLLGANSFNDIASDLNVHTKDDRVSPKQYSVFLRILFNSTYLGRAMSEKALGLLAKTDFNDGLRAGVPTNVTIVHKFGQASSVENGAQTMELHDCGIIYTKSPYALCIMTRGPQLNGLEKAIQDISRLVYQEQTGS